MFTKGNKIVNVFGMVDALPRQPRLLVPESLALGKASAENRALKDMLTNPQGPREPHGNNSKPRQDPFANFKIQQLGKLMGQT